MKNEHISEILERRRNKEVDEIWKGEEERSYKKENILMRDQITKLRELE